MRFAYGCFPTLMSLYFANYMVRREGLIPSCMVLSAGGLRLQKKRYSTATALPVLLKRFGLRFTGYLALSGLGAALPSLRRRSPDAQGLLGFKQLARAYGIPLVTSSDFSGPETLAELERFELDLFVTFICDQILREPLLSRPRMGCVNIHASLLPEFRGADSIFQAMLNDVTEIGVTLHRTQVRIDCGDSYGQIAFSRQPSDSHMLLLARSAAAGALLLERHVHALQRGAPPAGAPIDPTAARYPYRSWPERDELRRFRSKGLAYWRTTDLRRILRFEDVLGDHRTVEQQVAPATTENDQAKPAPGPRAPKTGRSAHRGS